MESKTLIVFLSVIVSVLSNDEEQPNIVFIVADDLGWSDISLHGSDQIPTPNIDILGLFGAKLQYYYTDSEGTATYSSVMTGKYASRLGMQGESIKAAEDRGLPRDEKLLSQWMQDLGYDTYLVGKWDLGFAREDYMPNNRGFDSFFGILGSGADYYTYNLMEEWNGTLYHGLNMYDNTVPAYDQKGHLTEVLTDRAVQIIREHNSSSPIYLHLHHPAPHVGLGMSPLQPPPDAIDFNDHIAHSARRLYAGLVTSVDKGVGQVISALAERDMLTNTIIVFVSDNGASTLGPDKNYGSNAPLRGGKGTPFEGGVRSTGILWSSQLPNTTYYGLYHVVDWLPTLYVAGGGKISDLPVIDGINQWDSIMKGLPSERKDVLITIDDLNGWAALRQGDYKLIVGHINDELSKFYGSDLTELRLDPRDYEEVLFDCETARVFRETLDMPLDMESAFAKRNACMLYNRDDTEPDFPCLPSSEKGCLFDIKMDPHETKDLWESSPDIMKKMSLRLRNYWAEMKPRCHPIPNKESSPKNRDFVWGPWQTKNASNCCSIATAPGYPTYVTRPELEYMVSLNIQSLKTKIAYIASLVGDSIFKSVDHLMLH